MHLVHSFKTPPFMHRNPLPCSFSGIYAAITLQSVFSRRLISRSSSIYKSHRVLLASLSLKAFFFLDRIAYSETSHWIPVILLSHSAVGCPVVGTLESCRCSLNKGRDSITYIWFNVPPIGGNPLRNTRETGVTQTELTRVEDNKPRAEDMWS